jgi:hypothetical protein
MTIIIAIITAFLFLNYFKQVNALKLNIKSSQIALQSSDSTALTNTFNILREEKQYEIIQTILEFETFDTMPSYAESCSVMTAQDYKNIIELFYRKNEIEKLSKILSPECLASMDKLYFKDPIMSFSISDLPRSLLAVDANPFTFRIKALKSAFVGVIAHALYNRFNDVNWNNLVLYPKKIPANEEHLPLSEAFSSSNILNRFEKSDYFYYLGHSMLKDSTNSDDIIWLVRAVLPLENVSVPPNIAESSHVGKKFFSIWNEQLFRIVSTLAFYLELVDIQNLISKSNIKKVLKDQIKEVREALRQFNDHVTRLLHLNFDCKPLKQILLTISSLYSIFMTDTFYSNTFISQTYRFVAKTFSLRASAAVQGDWLCNLFFMFWKRKFRALKMADISESIQIFFSRNPTVHSVIRAHSHYVSAFNYIDPNATTPSNFEFLIPADRLKQIYEAASWILATRYKEIPFKYRWKIHLKQSRTSLSDSNMGSSNVNTMRDLPKIPILSCILSQLNSYKRATIESFQMAVSSLNNFEVRVGTIRSFSQFKLIGNNFIKIIGIREALQLFFKLIVEIPNFRIILESLKDGRPVIIITPMMSKYAANILGQALAAATILSLKIPFVIDKCQLEVIFRGKEQMNSQLLERIKNFCNKASYLNLLSLDKRNSGYFRNSLEKYFRSFLSWSKSFEKSNDLQSESETLIEESFEEFNLRIFTGFKYNYLSSKFSFEEFLKILS